jgi:hypothetical protein
MDEYSFIVQAKLKADLLKQKRQEHTAHTRICSETHVADTRIDAAGHATRIGLLSRIVRAFRRALCSRRARR